MVQLPEFKKQCLLTTRTDTAGTILIKVKHLETKLEAGSYCTDVDRKAYVVEKAYLFLRSMVEGKKSYKPNKTEG